MEADMVLYKNKRHTKRKKVWQSERQTLHLCLVPEYKKTFSNSVPKKHLLFSYYYKTR